MSYAQTKYVSSGKQNDLAECTCTISHAVLLLINMLSISGPEVLFQDLRRDEISG